MVTETPGSAAPLLSLTVPSIVPLIAVDCADAAAAAANTSTSSVASTRADHTRVMNAVLLEVAWAASIGSRAVSRIYDAQYRMRVAVQVSTVRPPNSAKKPSLRLRLPAFRGRSWKLYAALAVGIPVLLLSL